MLLKKDTISVKLTTSGALDVVSIPVNLNKDSYKVTRLQCLVPKTENSTADSLVKVYSSTIDETGKTVWTSATYSLPYDKTICLHKFEYEVYEDDFPEEFCKENGDIELTFSYETLDEDGNMISLLPSSTLNLYIGHVGGAGQNPNPPHVSNYDATIANVNRLNKQIETKSEREETFLKYSINNLPGSIQYDVDGYKTPSILYEGVSFNISDMDYADELRQGNLIVTSVIDNQIIKQVETFIFEDSLAQRTIKLSTDKQVISVGKWSIKVDRQQDDKHIGEFLYVDKNGNISFTKALKDFITMFDDEIISEDTSAYDFSKDFKLTAKNKEEIKVELADDVRNFVDKAGVVASELALEIDPATFVMTASLLNAEGEVISTQSIDFPIESMVVDGSYANGIVTLTLQSGQEINVPISSLISGLVPETRKINGQPLSSDVNIEIFSGDYNDLENKPIIPEGVEIIDNLNSTATDKSLSANQGRELNNKLNKKVEYSEITSGLEGVNPFENYYTIPQIDNKVSEINEGISVNSTSISTLQASKQDKLTAGDNISISDNNVISAKSLSQKLYMHCFTFSATDSSKPRYTLSFSFVSTNSTEISLPDVGDYLPQSTSIGSYYVYKYTFMPATGRIWTTSNVAYNIIGVYGNGGSVYMVYNLPNPASSYNNDTISSMAANLSSLTGWGGDTVVEIN